MIRSHLRCCAEAVTEKVLCTRVHSHIQIVTQLREVKYNKNYICMNIMKMQIVVVHCSTLPFVSEKELALKVDLGSV